MSDFTVYDGTVIRCDGNAAPHTVTLSSAARPVVLKVFTDEPATVARDGVALERFPLPPGFDASNASWAVPPELEAANAGWLFAPTPGVLLIRLQHPGGSTRISF